MTTTTFRRSAHRRFCRDIPRGRMLLQLAIVADRDAERIICPDERRPWWRDPLVSEEGLAERARLMALGDELAGEAARLGVTGGTEAAFRDVYAAGAASGAAGSRSSRVSIS